MLRTRDPTRAVTMSGSIGGDDVRPARELELGVTAF
jgi:hypothetical protein